MDKERDKMFEEAIVVSDSHGWFEPMIEMFTAEGLTKPDGTWIAPDSVQLVHLGDAVDRGPESVKTFNWYRDLQKRLGNERVIRLVGNHEFAYCGGPPHYSAKEQIVRDLAPAMVQDGLVGDLKFAHAIKAGGRDWFLTHGGLDPEWFGLTGEGDTPEAWARYLNRVGRQFFRLQTPDNATLSKAESRAIRWEASVLTGVSPARGGQNPVSGVVWCDYVLELLKLEDTLPFGQIVGHHPSTDIEFSDGGNLVGVNVHYGLAQLLRVDLVTGDFTTSGIHGDEAYG